MWMPIANDDTANWVESRTDRHFVVYVYGMANSGAGQFTHAVLPGELFDMNIYFGGNFNQV